MKHRLLYAMALLGPPVVGSMTVGAIDTGTVYFRQYKIRNGGGPVINGCGSSSVVDLGNQVRGGGTAFSMSPNSGGGCAGGVILFAGELYSSSQLMKNGFGCSISSGLNSQAATGITHYAQCADSAGAQNWVSVAQQGFYKGTNCQPGDNCINGYSYTNFQSSPTLSA